MAGHGSRPPPLVAPARGPAGTPRPGRALDGPGQILREVHLEPPFFIEPQIARDYAIEVDGGDGVWREVLRIDGNRAVRRRHDLPAGTLAQRLRIIVHATHGDPAAGIGEVRCYAS